MGQRGVAIPSNRSGQFRRERGAATASGCSGSQSLPTDQGNSDLGETEDGRFIRVLGSQSLPTDQGNSDAPHASARQGGGRRQSQSLPTDQGNSDLRCHRRGGDRPPRRNPFQPIRAIPTIQGPDVVGHLRRQSQSLPTDQGNSDENFVGEQFPCPGTHGRNPFQPIRAIPTHNSVWADNRDCGLVAIPSNRSGQFRHFGR